MAPTSSACSRAARSAGGGGTVPDQNCLRLPPWPSCWCGAVGWWQLPGLAVRPDTLVAEAGRAGDVMTEPPCLLVGPVRVRSVSRGAGSQFGLYGLGPAPPALHGPWVPPSHSGGGDPSGGGAVTHRSAAGRPVNSAASATVQAPGGICRAVAHACTVAGVHQGDLRLYPSGWGNVPRRRCDLSVETMKPVSAAARLSSHWSSGCERDPFRATHAAT